MMLPSGGASWNTRSASTAVWICPLAHWYRASVPVGEGLSSMPGWSSSSLCPCEPLEAGGGPLGGSFLGRRWRLPHSCDSSFVYLFSNCSWAFLRERTTGYLSARGPVLVARTSTGRWCGPSSLPLPPCFFLRRCATVEPVE